MFGMSLMELGTIMVIVLIVMGPEKLPDIMKTVGKGIREVRKASNVLRDAMMLEDPLSGPGLGMPSPARPAVAKAPAAVPIEEAEIDYRSFVRPVDMTQPERPGDVTEIALSAATKPESHREVYLHVPYEETIGS